jgi:hypothetical protein
MTGEPVLYDPETDTLLVELRPWPAASPAEVNERVGGEDVADGLVVHYGPDGLPHAFEIEHASERPERVARACSAAPRQGLRRLSQPEDNAPSTNQPTINGADAAAIGATPQAVACQQGTLDAPSRSRPNRS